MEGPYRNIGNDYNIGNEKTVVGNERFRWEIQSLKTRIEFLEKENDV